MHKATYSVKGVETIGAATGALATLPGVTAVHCHTEARQITVTMDRRVENFPEFVKDQFIGRIILTQVADYSKVSEIQDRFAAECTAEQTPESHNN